MRRNWSDSCAKVRSRSAHSARRRPPKTTTDINEQRRPRRTLRQTRNLTLLFSVLVGVVSVTKPVVAPVGTRASIKDFETTLNSAATPVNSSS